MFVTNLLYLAGNLTALVVITLQFLLAQIKSLLVQVSVLFIEGLVDLLVVFL